MLPFMPFDAQVSLVLYSLPSKGSSYQFIQFSKMLKTIHYTTESASVIAGLLIVFVGEWSLSFGVASIF